VLSDKWRRRSLELKATAGVRVHELLGLDPEFLSKFGTRDLSQVDDIE
jgi:hypothetical protein